MQKKLKLEKKEKTYNPIRITLIINYSESVISKLFETDELEEFIFNEIVALNGLIIGKEFYEINYSDSDISRTYFFVFKNDTPINIVVDFFGIPTKK
ncbi:MAG: hypothetical protein FWC41_01910 [Firmicutes bacterium]|nr:hypothetical protein [Bacillota bacterium]